MDIETFAYELLEILGKSLPEYRIKVTKVLKNNDTELFGLIFKRDDYDVAPTLYINGVYEGYMKNRMTIEEVIGLLEKQLAENQKSCCQLEDLPNSMDYDTCKQEIVFRLVSRTRNEKLLKNIPFIAMLDLAIVFYIVKEMDATGVKSIKVTNELMIRWGIDVDELMKCAMKNTPQLFPAITKDIVDVIRPMLGEQAQECLTNDEKIDMIVITNEVGLNGASVILYKGVLAQLADEFDSDLVILPSSIHEVIVVPKKVMEGMSSCSEMVREINENYVDNEEILSDRVYFYLKDEKIIT